MPSKSAKTPHQNATPSRRATHHPRSWWLKHYNTWHSSGLSKSAYCNKHGIVLSSFSNWSARFDQEQPKQSLGLESPPAFFKAIPLLKQPTPQAAQARSVTVNDITVTFDQPLDSVGLLSWIRALQSC